MNTATKYLPARGDKRRHYIKTKPRKNMIIDLEREIVCQNTVTLAQEEKHLDAQRKLDFEIAKVESKVAEAYKAGVMSELGFDYETAEARRIRRERTDFAALPQNRIMSTAAIKATCLKYGLRFLPTRFYKGALDAGIGPAVENMKALLGGKLPENVELLSGYDHSASPAKPCFAIAAPSEAFALQPRPVDPLLFLRLNPIKWFLVHKWGDDLKTADIRKGKIGEHNWNSEFSDENTFRTGALTNREMFNQLFMGTTASPSQFITTGNQFDSSGIAWAQNAAISTSQAAAIFGR